MTLFVRKPTPKSIPAPKIGEAVLRHSFNSTVLPAPVDKEDGQPSKPWRRDALPLQECLGTPVARAAPKLSRRRLKITGRWSQTGFSGEHSSGGAQILPQPWDSKLLFNLHYLRQKAGGSGGRISAKGPLRRQHKICDKRAL